MSNEIEDKDIKALMIRLILFKDESLTKDETILATMGSLKYPSFIDEFTKSLSYIRPNYDKFENYSEYLLKLSNKDVYADKDLFDGGYHFGFDHDSVATLDFSELYETISKLSVYFSKEEISSLIGSKTPQTMLCCFYMDKDNESHQRENIDELLSHIRFCPRTVFYLLIKIFDGYNISLGTGNSLHLPLYATIQDKNNVFSHWCLQLFHILDRHYEICKQYPHNKQKFDLEKNFLFLVMKMALFIKHLSYYTKDSLLPRKSFFGEIMGNLMVKNRGETEKVLQQIEDLLNTSGRNITWVEI